jgi:sugar O-acyltransferase (sialic acid O-acetyltransferase NeuD family)
VTEKPIVIVGAGGHGRSVAEALTSAGRTVLGFVDPAVSGLIDGLAILGDDDWLDADDTYVLANGLGGAGSVAMTGVRRRVQTGLEARGFVFAQVVHPSAIISRHATVGLGAQILARTVVQPGAVIGRGAIINSGAIIEHGARIGDFAHCGPGSILCGDVCLGQNGHVGAGAVVREGVVLEDQIVVGAGAVVLSAGTGDGPLIGVPARRGRRQA